MSVVYVREQGSVVRRQGERLLVTKEDQPLMDIPRIHIEQLALFGNMQLTSPAIARCCCTKKWTLSSSLCGV